MKTASLAILSIVLAGIFVSPAQAHESRPAYLQITLSEGKDVRVLLKVPALGTQRLGLYLNFPEDCVATSESAKFLVDNAFTERSVYA